MKEHIIYDPGEPVTIRRYPTEIVASLGQALLAANGIPAFLRQNSYSEVDAGAVLLVVRREDATRALALLDAPPSADDLVDEADDDA